jgi:hypothetical protein
MSQSSQHHHRIHDSAIVLSGRGFIASKFPKEISIPQEITPENEKNAFISHFYNSLQTTITSVTSSTHVHVFKKAYQNFFHRHLGLRRN